MPLQKQSIPINFGKGLDLKTDPYQLQIGNFLSLENSVFTTAGRLTKRNGFQNLTSLPNTTSTTLTTLNDNLIATGTNLYAFSEDTNQWLNQGIVQPAQLNTLPLIRVSTSQSGQDSATAPNGLTCLAYVDNAQAYYIVSDSTTGQQIVKRTELQATALNPRVFVLGYIFVITFTVGTSLRCIAVPIANPNSPSSVITIAAMGSSSSGYDGAVMVISSVPQLYVAWGASGSVQIAYTTPSMAFSSPQTIAGTSATLMSVTTDVLAQNVYMSYWDGTSVYAASVNYVLTPVMSSTLAGTADISEITSTFQSGVLDIFYEVINNYGYDSAIRTDYIQTVVVTPPATTGPGTADTPATILRSVGLASKAFTQYTYFFNNDPTVIITDIQPPTNLVPAYTIVNITTYMLAVYGNTHQSDPDDDSNQPTYFLIDASGNIYMRLAYSNGGGYVQGQVLPSVSFVDKTYFVSYLNNDFLATVNKGTNLPAGTPSNAIYTQTGVNLSMFTLNTTGQLSSEIASSLHLTGGMLWQYDGVKPIEHNFHVWPENVEVTTMASGGSIAVGTYYYQFTYEWTDNAGNLHRSAPSIPVTVTTGGTATNTLNVPTYRLTYKQPLLPPSNVAVTNPVRIVGYRWSVAQQVYYQFTSLTAPIKNDTTIDYVTITDTLSDAEILGNTILYTTGGVIEDIAAPASVGSALFDTRLWLIDAEDRNLLWYSKQVIENVPVEMSDLLTFYVAPSTSAQGSTGVLTALYPMDDKLILFKKDAIYYINGTGPDNTGANSQYPTTPIFITAAVGCNDPQSITLTPNGLMFQSDKGIWLLGRDLSTNYIGAPVETYNSIPVLSAMAIPATTQVRFVIDDSLTLMYDYFYEQWGTHSNIEAISSTLYQGLHTYLNSAGQIFQETPGSYLDGSSPVLLSLTSSWINIAGLQGFERFYFLYLLGTYLSPFQLNVSLAYNYNSSPSQTILVSPNQSVPNWGDEAVWGAGGPWGGPETGASDNNQGNVFAVRLFPSTQKCSSFQLSIQEVYDPTVGQPAGAGLTLSGLNLIIGSKKGYRTQSAKKSFG